MIKNTIPLSMAEATEYIGETKDSEVEVKKFIKRFVKLDHKEAKEMKAKLESLNLIKVRPEYITKIIDFLPEDVESLNKIFIDVSLDEDESKKIIKKVKSERESRFVEFFNKSEAINKRIHQIELLPGLGKKHMQEILKQRKEKPFESFADMKKRIQNLPDPEKAVEKRIIKELTSLERHNLFVH